MSTETSPLLPFFDPHFHLWSVHEGDPHDVETLGDGVIAEKGGYPQFLLPQYEALFDESQETTGVKLIGGIFTEAIPTSDEPVEELTWACKHLAKENTSGRTYHLMGRINLSRATSEAECEEALRVTDPGPYKCLSLRHIINYEPSWPRVKSNLLEDETWRSNFPKTVASRICDDGSTLRVFDLQCNPHQFKAAAALIAQFPDLRVVVNHMGCLKLNDDQDKEKISQTWFEGMSALAAASPNVYVKLSWDTYTVPLNDRKPGAQFGGAHGEMVAVLVDMFGPKRLMAASNYPVSLLDGSTPEIYFEWLLRQSPVQVLSREQQEDILAWNAMRCYIGEASVQKT